LTKQPTLRPLKTVALFALVIFCFSSVEVGAQNTKGDKPANNQKSIFRLPKLKSKKKGGDKAYTRDISGRRRIRTKNKSSAVRAIETVAPVNANRKPSGDKFVRTKPRSSNVRRRASGDRAYKQSGGTNFRIRSRTAEASRNNVYPKNYQYSSNPSPRPRDNQKAYDNGRVSSGLSYQVTKRKPPGRKKIITPRTASRSFITRGRKNVYWGKFRKGERPITTDITGRTLRAKNYHTPGLGVIPSQEVYKIKRKKPGDQAFTGKFGNRYSSKAPKERPWRGNVSGNALRSSPPRSTQNAGKVVGLERVLSATPKSGAKRRLQGGGYSSRSSSGRVSKAIPVKAPGLGASAFQRFLGKFSGRKPLIGGQSTRLRFNNKGRPIQGRTPGIGARFVGTYQGNIRGRKGYNADGYGFAGNLKGQRPLKGGGSVSGRGRNNSGQPVTVKGPGIGGRFVDTYQGNIRGKKGFNTDGYGFAGNLKGQRPLKGGGSVSGRGRNNSGQPVTVKGPGIGGRFVDTYQGNIQKRKELSTDGYGYSGTIKTQRPLKGGGSISGRSRNNSGRPITVKGPGIGGRFVDVYSGSIKAQRPLKGGGSISGRSRNNSGRPVIVKGPGVGGRFVDTYQGNLRKRKDFSTDGYGYTGAIKAQRPLKGGGSISNRSRNNSGKPIIVKGPGIGGRFLDTYQGTIKTQRPLKGGGSVSGKLWNNNNHPIQGKAVAPSGLRIGTYSGNIKAQRPVKGGGSVSGKLWNNKEQPIQGKSYDPAARKVGSYVSGFMQNRYIRNPNSKEEALKKSAPDKSVYAAGGLQIKVKSRGYELNKNSKEGSLKKISPTKSTYAVGDLQIRTKAKDYEHNKLSAKGALKGESSGKNSLKAIEYNNRIQVFWKKTFEKGNQFAGRVPMRKYVHNPNSKKGALMVFAPGKAVAQLKDYQGNLKMGKPHGNNLHPDAQFAHGHRDNVKGERTFLMNLKLKWAKLFKKNDTQPAAVKERTHRPRYDKKERELWKDLYD